MLDPAVEKRILAAINHEEGDRVPIWDYMDNRGIVDHICPGWTDYHAAMVQVYHTLGIDMCRGYGGSYAETDDGAENQADGVTVSKITGRSHWIVRYPISNPRELRDYSAEPVSEDWARGDWVESLRAAKARFEPNTMYIPGAGCGFHATYGLMGQEFFCYAIYDDPVNVERILEIETETCYRMTKAAVEANLAPIYFIGDDVAYKGALMFSPDFLRRTFIKSLAKCCEPAKAAGMKVIFHSDGYVMEILYDMIEAGIDGLNPIEPIAGMDIGYLKKRYGKNLVLVGNVDCSQVLPLGSVDDVVAATKTCLREAGHGGGLLIGSSSEIVPCTPVENILTFYDTCRTWGTYPLRV